MRILLDALFSAVALSHFAVDVLNGQRAVLLAYLSEPLGLSNAGIGLVSTAYVMAAALTQPLFGYVADRMGSRWVVAGGVLWIGVFFSLGVVTPGAAGLALLVVASVGSGAFHPAGTMQATLQGRAGGRETTAAAYFFLFGQGGLFLGPLLGGFILDRAGAPGLLALTALALPIGLNALFRLRGLGAAPIQGASGAGERAPAASRARVGWLALLAFVGLAGFQSWAQQNMVTFVPKYLSDLGQTASVYGVIASLFMGGSALGNVAGGNLADRFGRRRVAAVALTLASVPLFLVPLVGWSPWLYLLIPLAGFLTGATHSIIVVLAQRILPTGMALASGLILGFMFSSGALGTLASGYIADLWDITVVFRLSALFVLLAAGLALSLQKS